MTECIKKYERSVKKALHCGKAAKVRLLARFHDSLQTFLEENPSPDAQALHDAFGPPEEMARLLMEDTIEAERAQYRRNKLFLRISAGVLVAAILLFAIYICFKKSEPVEYFNDIIVNETRNANEPVEKSPN